MNEQPTKNIIFVLMSVLLFAITLPKCNAVQSNFDYAIKVVLQHEGTLSDDKNDPGGITNYGISLRYLKLEHIDEDGNGKIDSDDIVHLTQTEADSIYLNDWWRRYHYNLIKDKEIATKILDSSVNMGASQCHKLVKHALSVITQQAISIDGNLDSKTISLINSVNSIFLHQQIRNEEYDFYKHIVNKNSHLKVFLNGWMRRASW